jgi:hypothetical protein
MLFECKKNKNANEGHSPGRHCGFGAGSKIIAFSSIVDNISVIGLSP